MSVVLDCSIALSWYLPDESNSAADKLLKTILIDGAHVPIIFRTEFANSLLMAARRGRISDTFRDNVLNEFNTLSIQQDYEGTDKCWPDGVSLCDRHILTAYDASYLELALRKKLPLATLDKKLTAAAIVEGVTVYGQKG